MPVCRMPPGPISFRLTASFLRHTTNLLPTALAAAVQGPWHLVGKTIRQQFNHHLFSTRYSWFLVGYLAESMVTMFNGFVL